MAVADVAAVVAAGVKNSTGAAVAVGVAGLTTAAEAAVVVEGADGDAATSKNCTGLTLATVVVVAAVAVGACCCGCFVVSKYST